MRISQDQRGVVGTKGRVDGEPANKQLVNKMRKHRQRNSVAKQKVEIVVFAQPSAFGVDMESERCNGASRSG